ncbi:hypothetical protein DFS33DRAFT_370864 [Desarmillaria ectypa]|nr:hypothetical protein DFS33DRAFT_370864 [Desarmillaria ectypa]
MSRNPYNPNRVDAGDYPDFSSYYPNMEPPVFRLDCFDTGSKTTADKQHAEASVGPDRHPRSRVRPEAPGSDYHTSRAGSSQMPSRPVTPPSSSATYYSPYAPETPPRKKYSIDLHKTVLPHRWKSSPGKGGVAVLPDKPVALLPYVSHRGSLVPTDADGKPLPPRPFIFDYGRQVDPQTPCSDKCAHFQFMQHEDYKLREEKTVVVKQPGPIPSQRAVFITFMDRRIVVDFPDQNERGCGVLLRDVLDPPGGFSLVDDNEVVNPFGAHTVLLNIDVRLQSFRSLHGLISVDVQINGYPPLMESINVRCSHGRVTRYGILKAVAELYYRITHTSTAANGVSNWRNRALPRKIKFENLRLISLYTLDGAIWNSEYIFVSPKKSRKSD